MRINWSKYKDFKPSEFECRCGCGLCNVSERLVRMLQRAKNISKTLTFMFFKHRKGVPFVIERGCSCQKHNDSIKGSSTTSSHVATEAKQSTAVDIRVRNPRERFIILFCLFLAGFRRIGLYNSHNGVHCDIDESKDKYVVWKK